MRLRGADGLELECDLSYAGLRPKLVSPPPSGVRPQHISICEGAEMPQSHAESLARQVIARLRSAGHQAYFVGGCVRDLLRGASPKDFDISTDARPDRIMDLFPRSGLVGAHFGVVLVRDAFAQVEVATFRSDHEYEDGR